MLCREINAIYSENKSRNMCEKLQENYTAEDIIYFQRKWQYFVARMEEYRLLILAYLHHRSGRCTLGKPKQKWKDQEYLQV
jgi:hypothetical protein